MLHRLRRINRLKKKPLKMRYVSCLNCGFSREIKNKEDNWGYCVRLPCKEYKGEHQKIKLGQEEETARQCPKFRKRVAGMSDDTFVQLWATIAFGEKTDRVNKQVLITGVLGVAVTLTTYLLDHLGK